MEQLNYFIILPEFLFFNNVDGLSCVRSISTCCVRLIIDSPIKLIKWIHRIMILGHHHCNCNNFILQTDDNTSFLARDFEIYRRRNFTNSRVDFLVVHSCKVAGNQVSNRARIHWVCYLMYRHKSTNIEPFTKHPSILNAFIATEAK